MHWFLHEMRKCCIFCCSGDRWRRRMPGIEIMFNFDYEVTSDWKSSDWEHSCAKTGGNIEIKRYFNSRDLHHLLAPGTTENATFAHFMTKSMYLKSGCLSDYKVLFLLRRINQKAKQVCSFVDRRSMASLCRWFCPLLLKWDNLLRKTDKFIGPV